ncbi:MAG: CocE/NonD family hydrolase [Pseudomonadota bacterium]
MRSNAARSARTQSGTLGRRLMKSNIINLQNTPDPETVTREEVSFDSAGVRLVGMLFKPKDGSEQLPAAVVTGAWTTVKEQMAGTYARELAARGFVALTFDLSGWGQSDGEPRFVEDHAEKTADIKAAFQILASQPEVEPASLHGLGICASAGYMVDAASGNPNVASVGLVAPWLQNQDIVRAVYGGEEGVEQLIQVARDAEAAGGVLIPAAGPADAEGVLMAMDGYYADPSRGAIEAYDNQWNQASWEAWLTYTPANDPARLDKPLAVVHSDAAAIPEGVRTFLSGFVGEATQKWLEDVTQFDFYDDPEAVNTAADTLAAHFAANAGQ